MGSTRPNNIEGEDIVCSLVRTRVDAILHRNWRNEPIRTYRYDGDTCSLTCVFVDESVQEVTKMLNSRDYYIAPDGSMAFSSSNDVLDLVLGNLA